VKNITERDIVGIWQQQLLESGCLATEDGKLLMIIYPGRLNDEQGADFQGAVIVSGGRLLRGDIEIHINSSGWYEHGHDIDAVYNRIVLHVVMRHNSRKPTRLQNGREVPVLALGKYTQLAAGTCPAPVFSSAFSNTPCNTAASLLSEDTLAEILDKAGEERFLAKVAGFQRDSARAGAGQALYQGMMGALGYSRNKLPFLELSRRVPLRCLESESPSDVSEAEWLGRRQVLLLGVAGLPFGQSHDIPMRNPPGDGREVETVRLRAASHNTGVMSPDAWHLRRVRPGNSPITRLAAMSHLLLRYREKGLLDGMLNLVGEAPLGRDCHKILEAGLEVSIDDNCISGSSRGINRVTLLGRGRAADIIVNVLLPFTFAWGHFNGRPELGGKAGDIYRLYPRLTLNSVERHMTQQLGLDARLVKSAKRQQGLIHIYKTLCSLGRCKDCPLGQLESRNHI